MASATPLVRRGHPCWWPLLFIFNALVVPAVLAAVPVAPEARATDRTPSTSIICPLGSVAETAVVDTVIDGDTLVLRDGRHVRLLGLNAPEIAHRDSPGQPFGEAARGALRKIVPRDARVQLRNDKEAKDKYGRTLAHVATAQGVNLSAHIIAAGLAIQWAVPPNDWNAECYAQAEREARRVRRGMWASDVYRVTPATELSVRVSGYHRVQGHIKRVREYPEATLLYLEGPLRLRIRTGDAPYFSVQDWKRMVGKTMVVRGWIHPVRSGLEMPLRHETAIEEVGADSP